METPNEYTVSDTEQKPQWSTRLTAEPSSDLKKRFTYHRPIGDQPERYEIIRNLGLTFVQALTAMCPQSRELSLAITRIEEASMWANAAIARNETIRDRNESEPANDGHSPKSGDRHD